MVLGRTASGRYVNSNDPGWFHTPSNASHVPMKAYTNANHKTGYRRQYKGSKYFYRVEKVNGKWRPSNNNKKKYQLKNGRFVAIAPTSIF